MADEGYISSLDAAATLDGSELLEVSQLSPSVTITATTIEADSADNSFNDSGSGFVAAGFAAGDRVHVEGFTGDVANNLFVGIVTALSPGKMTIGGTDGDVIADDAAGESVTITKWVTRRASVQDIADAGSGPTFATAAEVRAGTESAKAVAPENLTAAMAVQTLTDGATISWDMSAAINAKITLTASGHTLAVSNPKQGATYSLGVIQDGTGSRTMNWPSSFDWGTAGAPTLTTTASKRDRITVFCTDASTPKFDAFLSGKGFG